MTLTMKEALERMKNLAQYAKEIAADMMDSMPCVQRSGVFNKMFDFTTTESDIREALSALIIRQRHTNLDFRELIIEQLEPILMRKKIAATPSLRKDMATTTDDSPVVNPSIYEDMSHDINDASMHSTHLISTSEGEEEEEDEIKMMKEQR